MYIGRFAPSPTGPLHLGSLFAAVISFLHAKKHGGQWRLRIEDIDTPRTQPGAADAILRTLENHALFWDDKVTKQSEHLQRYQHHLSLLAQNQSVFWCQCSRRDLAGHKVYPGTCRKFSYPRNNSSIRFLMPEQFDEFDDEFQGLQQADVKNEFGDVVLFRRDGLFAYQLAVVCDDFAEGVTHVIRGIDLLSSTWWQRALCRALGFPIPKYGHFPVLLDTQSQQKLSKQNLSAPVENRHAGNNLHTLFKLMGLNVAPDVPERMLAEALECWQPNHLYDVDALQTPDIELHS